MKQNADGSFEGGANTEYIDSKGTKVKEVTTEKRKVLSDGVIEDNIKTETSADPKGLMNKTIERRETSTKIEPSGKATQQIRAESIDETGTKRTQAVNTAQSPKEDGTIETNIKEKVITNPKGILNETTTESNTVVVQHPDGKTSVENKTE